MPKQGEKDDNRKWNAKEKKEDGPAHDLLPQLCFRLNVT